MLPGWFPALCWFSAMGWFLPLHCVVALRCCSAHTIHPSPNSRAISMSCTSVVPSPTSKIFESR